MSGPVASSPPERASRLCGAETFWNSLADSVSSSFPSPQNRLANLALPAEVRAKIKKQIYNTHDIANAEIYDYIEMFYIRTRRHSHFSGVSPEAFEAVLKWA